MLLPPTSQPSHPEGEPESKSVSVATRAGGLQPARVPLDLHGRRIYVEWDPHAPVTPLGQLVYFSQFLATAGLFTEWVADCPLHYTSPNAPAKADVLGTMLPGGVGGQNRRYAHVTALRGDTVNPQGLGMSRVMSEDAVRPGRFRTRRPGRWPTGNNTICGAASSRCWPSRGFVIWT